LNSEPKNWWKIPQAFIDDVVVRTDIVDVIDARLPLKKAGQNYKACCPFHNEKTPSFVVSPQKQIYHCFGCNVTGSVIGFLMDYDHLNFHEAVQELATLNGLTLPKPDHKHLPATNNDSQLYELLEKANHYYKQQLRSHPQAQVAVDYLKMRGLDGETAAQYELGYAPPGWQTLNKVFGHGETMTTALIEAGLLVEKADNNYDRFRHRIMFPIRDKRGRIIGFGGRVLGDDTPKYLNSPETNIFHKNQQLYGLYQARKNLKNLSKILVVEGYMDVVALAQFDVKYAVATMGTAISAKHLSALYRHTQHIIFCFDGDQAGRNAAWKALETCIDTLQDDQQIQFMFLAEGEDPDSYIRKIGKTHFESELDNSTTLMEFFFETLGQQANLRGIDGQARLIARAKPYLEKLKNSTYYQLMIARLSEYVQLTTNDLAKSIAPKPQKKYNKANKSAAKTERPLSPSPIRIAIALLLEQPNLAMSVKNLTRFDSLELPGIKLLQDLLEFLQANPQVKIAAILEHWRGSNEGKQLLKVAQWPHLVPDDGVLPEFDGAIARLDQMLIEKKTEYLLQKSKTHSLSNEEKDMLNQLIKSRHKPNLAT